MRAAWLIAKGGNQCHVLSLKAFALFPVIGKLEGAPPTGFLAGSSGHKGTLFSESSRRPVFFDDHFKLGDPWLPHPWILCSISPIEPFLAMLVPEIEWEMPFSGHFACSWTSFQSLPDSLSWKLPPPPPPCIPCFF